MRGIALDDVELADWYLCEACGDVADSLSELGFCYTLGDKSLQQQIAEYRREEAAHIERMKAHNLNYPTPVSHNSEPRHKSDTLPDRSKEA